MQMSESRFCINQPAVIAEVIDGEAIIVNLESGAYYSLRDSGAAIWDRLVQGATPAEAARALTGVYSDSVDVLQLGVETLLAQLLEERILMPGGQSPVDGLPAPSTNDSARPFQMPVLDKYTDMTDLLLLDPIHEVDTKGWPHPASPR